MLVTYIEQSGDKLPKAALITIGAALKAKAAHGYDRAIGVMLGGEGTASVADQASRYGLDEIWFLESPLLSNYLALPFSEVLTQFCKDRGAKCFLACASSRGRDLVPRIAFGLDAGQASDVIAFLDNRSYRRPMYAGNVIAEVELTTEIHAVSIRQTAFEPALEVGSACSVQAVTVSVPETNSQEFVSFETVKSERPELTEASIVVSGGRALKSSDNFTSVIAPLADAFGAAIGASRAAVDSGYAPNDWQVGQTGKVVAPSLYVAVGISGAIQHLAGMKDSKVIVAINKDAEAPIFEVADYGLVGDLFQILPELTELVKKARGV